MWRVDSLCCGAGPALEPVANDLGRARREVFPRYADGRQVELLGNGGIVEPDYCRSADLQAIAGGAKRLREAVVTAKHAIELAARNPRRNGACLLRVPRLSREESAANGDRSETIHPLLASRVG